MKTHRPLLHLALALMVLGGGTAVHGQGGGASRLAAPPASDRKKMVDEAQERLRQAQRNGQLDKAKGTARGLMDKLPGGVTEAARSALQNPETKAQAIDAAKAAIQSLRPEAERMLKSNPDAAAAAAAAAGGQMPPAAVPADTPVDTTPAAGPAPLPLPLIVDQPPGTGAPGSSPQSPMVQIESDRADFNPEEGVFIYNNQVKARHPDFYIQCEQLEVYMDKEKMDGGGAKNAKAAPKRKDPVRAGAGGGDADDSGIKKAIASGPMVTIEKRDEDGNIQQGRCRRLTYDQATGIITLSGQPQVQRGNMLQIATDPSTTMTFDKKGKMNTSGPSSTVILNKEEPPSN